MNDLLHTPEGVRDIVGEECKQKFYLNHRLTRLLSSYGYDPIQTPVFEFSQIFGQEIGTTSDKDLYKFFDREGNTLALRPDFTPSVARASAKYFSTESAPLRLFYRGEVFHNTKSLRGKLKESTQIGGELIGDSSIEADAEIIALIVHAFKVSGLDQFQISIGHAGLFAGLTSAAGFSREEIEDISSIVSNKNFFGLEEYLNGKAIDPAIKDLFGLLSKTYVSPDDWKEYFDQAKEYPKICAALSHLYDMNDLLASYGVEDYVTFDLGLIRSYQYYTGIIFSGYTFGSGEPIVSGGRYDDLLGHFGIQRPAIGFAILLDQLLLALERQHIPFASGQKRTVVLYHQTRSKEAIKTARQLRLDGKTAVLWHYSSKDEYQLLEQQLKSTDAIVLLEEE
ncbi:MAG: ATP phosphoribosyltransferase regulatory subunit [Candidatus Weimeria sp.]|nr:ATP phosphoribosyltransferase regulatory subunit [Candidatus Weimeria sp.]